MRTNTAMILSALAIISCFDTNLVDELNWPDGSLPPSDGSVADVAGDDDSHVSSSGDDSGWPELLDSSIQDDTTPPWIVPAAGCTSDESLFGSFCASTGPFGIGLRFWASEPVVAAVHIEPGGEIARCDSPDVAHHLMLAPLSPESAFEVTVEVFDVADLSALEGPVTIHTSPTVAPVVINELLFDPLGTEPHQEFVELYNIGSEDVDLAGWTIADEGGADTLTSTSLLRAGGLVVIVSDQYQPGIGGDPPPSAGALMIRLDGPIGSQGLRNSGEPLTLTDTDGQVVSFFPAPTDVPDSGTSVERVNPYAPDGAPANWLPNALESSTPGSLNSVAEGE